MWVVLQAAFGVGDADHAQQFSGAVFRLFTAHAQMQLERLGDLRADREHRVERCHRVLKDHGDLGPAHGTHLVLRQLEQIAPLEDHFSAFDLSWRTGDQAQNGERVNTLTAAAFADDAQRFALVEHVGHIVDRVDHAFLRIEARDEVFDLH